MPVDKRTQQLATLVLVIQRASSLDEVKQAVRELDSLADQYQSDLLARGRRLGYEDAARELQGIII